MLISSVQGLQFKTVSDPEIFLYKDQWNDNYKAWLQMGGSQYKQPTVID